MALEPTSEHPILVLGGTGTTGRRVVERLRHRDVPIRIGSRRAVRPFDWDAPATWGPVLEGVRAVYVSFAPDLAVPGAAETVGAFARQAVAAGAERLVLVSGRGEQGAERGEQAVQDSGAAWTIVRSSWFDQNFSEHYLLPGVLNGEVALPVGDMVEPFVDADDIADVAVAALTGDGHAGRLYELTGPQLLTFADAVAEISHATGRDIRFVSVSMDDYAAMLVREGVPAVDIELIAYLFTEVLDGRNASLADGVQRALGRAPRDFRTYARDAAATGVWTVDEVAIR
jgi:uncharacterized protein YbjT (DUF2867 family)